MLLPFALTLAYGSLQCPRRSRSYLLLRRPSNEQDPGSRQSSLSTTSPSCRLRRSDPGLRHFSLPATSCRRFLLRCLALGSRHPSLSDASCYKRPTALFRFEAPPCSSCAESYLASRSANSHLLSMSHRLPGILIRQFPLVHCAPTVRAPTLRSIARPGLLASA